MLQFNHGHKRRSMVNNDYRLRAQIHDCFRGAHFSRKTKLINIMYTYTICMYNQGVMLLLGITLSITTLNTINTNINFLL